MIAGLKMKKTKQSLRWKSKHFNAVVDSKNSVINKHNSHHGSKGLHFSFGNKAQYQTINNSSVGQYAIKKGITTEKKIKCLLIEELVARELKDGIDNVGRILPNFKDCIAPVLKVADDLQAIVGDIHIKRGTYHDYGIWKSVVSINSQTEELHTEDDCSYTVITVPHQASMKKRDIIIFSSNSMNMNIFHYQ